jgi:hypothetical protein
MLYDTGATTPKIKIYEVRDPDTGRVLERTNIKRDAKALADTHECEVWEAGGTKPIYVGERKPAATPEGCLTSSQVADLWGCHPKTVEYRMRKLGIDPVDTGVYLGRVRDRTWKSGDVARAILDWRPYGRKRPDLSDEILSGDGTAEPEPTAEDLQEDPGQPEPAEAEPRDWPDGLGPAHIPAAVKGLDLVLMETRDLPSPALLELIADRVDRLQIDVSRLSAGLARLDAESDTDELARLRRPVSAAALARIVSVLGDVDVDAAGPWLVLRRPAAVEVAA